MISERGRAVIALGVSTAVFFALAVGVGVWALGYVDPGVRGDHPGVSVTAFVVVAFALGLLINTFVARSARVVAIAMLGWVPLLFVIGHTQLSRAIAPGPTTTDPWLASLAVELLAFMIGAPLAVVVAPWVSSRALRPVSRIVWGLGALLVVLAFERLRTRPDPDGYLDTLPVVGTIHPMSEVTFGGLRMRMPEGHDYGACWLEEVSAATHRITSETLSCTSGGLSILRDDANDLWIVRQTTSASRSNPGQAAMRGTPPMQLDTIYPRTLRRRPAPPVGWVHGAAGGLVLALLAIVAGLLFRGRGDHERATGAHASAIAIVMLSCATLVAAAVNGLIGI